MYDRLRDIEARFDELTDEMGRPEVSADYARLQEERRAILEQIEREGRVYA